MKQSVAFALALVMLFSMLPLNVFAAEMTDETQMTDAAEVTGAADTVQTAEGDETLPSEDHVHTPVADAAVAATCTETGLTAGSHCETCSEILVEQEVVPVTGHSYENGICSGCGSTASPYLQQLPENFTGCSNLYDILSPVKGYYTAQKYDTSNGAVLSVVIPVEPGDRIAANSFGSVSENMGSVNGIRVTYLLDGEIVKSLSAGSVYDTYTQKGYLTVPEGVNMVCVPWWTPSDSNWLTLGQISKNYAAHSPEAVSRQEPTCTQVGYTEGIRCALCSLVLEGCQEIPKTAHNFENSFCTGCSLPDGASPYLQPLPDAFLSCENLYAKLTPAKGYYTATEYLEEYLSVVSVVIPVEPGDRIAANSFGPVSENMGSVNGIRVTYLLDGEIVKSLSASSVYNTYTQNGYLTVPEGANMVCVPWWTSSDSNWLTLGQISKNFAAHSPKAAPAQAPTCTEKGYTAGEICEFCGASLGSREEIPATGHDYDGNTCTICAAVNELAFLDGKYVSVLGDSISTFNGYSNDATVNSTIGGNGYRYNAGTADTKPGSYCLLESVDDTWWMQFANRSGMKLLVNNSWAGSQVFGGQTSDGRKIPPAYLERCINLHDNTLGNNPDNAPINPDVIFVYLGINDYNFNRSQVGSGAVDYAKLVSSDGTYVTPATFGEAYGILLHRMRSAYPDAQIFAMTLLPENLYSVDKTAWAQHNAYIRAAAEYYDIPLVDLAENCGITWENYSGYMMDKIHPTTAGMALISDCIEKELVAYYKKNPPHTHTYTAAVTAPTCTKQGYTTYACDCGDSYVDDYVDPTGEHSYENGICKDCSEVLPGPVIVKQPAPDYAVIGEKATVRVEAQGRDLTYQWYYRDSPDGVLNKSTVTKNTYTLTVKKTNVNRELYCVITDGNGNQVKTDVVKLLQPLEKELKIVTQPVPDYAVIGEKATVFVEAEGVGLTYQWYYRDSTDGVLSKSTVTKNTYTLTVKKTNVNRELYCVITDAHGNQVTTDTVKLLQSLEEELRIITQPVSSNAAIGEKAAVPMEAQGVGLTYQWYFRESPTGSLSKSICTASTYTATVTKYNTQRELYCVITDGHGNQVQTDTVKMIAPAKMYYTSISDALEGTAGSTSPEGAVAEVSRESGENVITLLQNTALTETLTIAADVVFDLNGYTVSSDVFPMICVDAGSCTIRNGDITLTGDGIGIDSAPAVAITVASGAALDAYETTVTVIDAADGTVVGITTEADSSLVLTQTDVTVTTGRSLSNVAINTKGKAVLRDCSIIAEADYTGAGNAYTSYSRGIYAKGELELYNCYVWGAHSGVTATGKVYVDGGTYEGYGHGGFYLASAGETSYFYNAAFNWAKMRAGTTADSVAGTNNAAFYIGADSNITAYFDNCSFKSNNATKSYCLVLRSSGGESDNGVYVSNSSFGNYKKYAYRIGNAENTNNLYAYSGVGNTYSGRVFNYSGKGFNTDVSYSK